MAVSKRTRFEVLRRDNYTCRYCRSTENQLTVDHVTPDRPAYFAGICWKRLRAMQEIAQQIVDGEG